MDEKELRFQIKSMIQMSVNFARFNVKNIRFHQRNNGANSFSCKLVNARTNEASTWYMMDFGTYLTPKLYKLLNPERRT